jgi:hypothetical protein
LTRKKYEAGVVGRAVRLGYENGKDTGAEQLYAPDSNDLDLAGTYTIEAFIKPDNIASGTVARIFVTYGAVDGYQYTVSIQT